MKRLLKFIIALCKHIILGSNVSEDVFQKRLSTCNSCNFLVKSRCSICTCYVKQKAKWETESCPKNKW